MVPDDQLIWGDTEQPSIARPKLNQGKETKSKKWIPSLDDPYEHAPPKPDGDPWAILLKPEMEADKVQCDAWKDEVQNLLIFAGLFSAVVTAFVIESYKFLQPDPNDTIISLLSQIASSPNLTSLSTGAAPFLTLSLATVLIGTIALQWLREYQAYPGFSPKQTLALLHMRSEALEAWYVPQMFAALPLLLQVALVLFLAGLIDFTLPLGLKLSIPIIIVIGFILLFLGATTVLPAVQGLLLLSGRFSRDKVPSPCAYKSPQSQNFRTLSGFILYLLSFIFPEVYLRGDLDGRWGKFSIRKDKLQIFPHTHTIWRRKLWPSFDLEWLSLRDTWHNYIHDKRPHLNHHRDEWKDFFPLSDITQCLLRIATEATSAKHTEEFLVATCACFQKISQSIWEFDSYHWGVQVDRRSHYFDWLFQPALQENPNVFPDWSTQKPLLSQHRTLFYQDQTYRFRAMLLDHHRSPLLECFQKEIQSRIIPRLLESNFQQIQVDVFNRYLFNVPPILCPPYDIRELSFDEFDKVQMEAKLGTVSAYTASLLAVLFENGAFCSVEDSDLNPLYTHRAMRDVLDVLAEQITSHLESLAFHSDASSRSNEIKIGVQYGSIFRLAARYLHHEFAGRSQQPTIPPSILFFHSAMILKLVRHWLYVNNVCVAEDCSFSQGLLALLDALATCRQQLGDEANKTWFGDTIITNSFRMEERVGVFSNRWWVSLFAKYTCRPDRCVRIDPGILGRTDSTSGDVSGIANLQPVVIVPSNLGQIPVEASPNDIAIQSLASMLDASIIASENPYQPFTSTNVGNTQAPPSPTFTPYGAMPSEPLQMNPGAANVSPIESPRSRSRDSTS
ncbi:hypothetical protein BDN70DRAFT_996554 [Pholiota conissans]|uniref:DUF6535 domain-containing protein n=1 Tax=Pholiota conissans TaxID=109636 RepID=A0A9P5YWK7_9AGAR|nr:hypothetical protein BDN70DRAFT_996554 [Pholiota conissans]